MKHLLGQNGRYGCMMFEINIPAGYTIEEVKKIHEDIGYKCYIFDEKQFTEYEESMKGEED